MESFTGLEIPQYNDELYQIFARFYCTLLHKKAEEIGRRGPKLWEFFTYNSHLSRLELVKTSYKEVSHQNRIWAEACEIKTRLFQLMVTFDDQIDEKGETVLLDTICHILEDGAEISTFPLPEVPYYYEEVELLINHIVQALSQYSIPPREIKKLLKEKFDEQRWANLVILRGPYYPQNWNELFRANQLTMGYSIFKLVDLICQGLNVHDLNMALGVSEEMCNLFERFIRISNSLGTYEKEVMAGDFSSDTVVQALKSGVISPEQLEQAKQNLDIRQSILELIARSSVLDSFYTAQNECLDRLSLIAATNKDLRVDILLNGAKQFYQIQMNLKGQM